MSTKAVNLVLIVFLLTSAECCPALANRETEGPQKDSILRVYLPREVTVKDNCFTLGQVSVVRGEEPLVARAEKIALGRISVPGQKIVFGRSVVLSRLASNGIPSSKVMFTGAEKIAVKREHQIIKGEEFVELASSYLKKNSSVRSGCQLNPVCLPKDLVMPGASEDIKFCPRLAGSGAANRVKVQIDVLADGKQIATRDVTFVLEYSARRAVALVDISAGATISAENVKIEQVPSNYPEPAGWSPPYGLIAKRQIAANTAIHPHMIGPLKPPVVISRNQTVLIRIEIPGLLVTAVGKALREGRAGEYIKVQNKDSKRIILARVNEDGTVKPVL